MIIGRWLFGLALVLAFASAVAQDTDDRFDSADEAKTPLSVPLNRIERRINEDPAAEGVKMSIRAEGRVLRLDILSMPGTTTVAAAERLIFITARLARPDYDEMRFSDNGEDLYVIDGETVRAIGRQFLWGEEGKGQNPIHLMRLFVDALKRPDGSRAAPPFNGSLLGDTGTTMQFISKDFNVSWVMRNIKVE